MRGADNYLGPDSSKDWVRMQQMEGGKSSAENLDPAYQRGQESSSHLCSAVADKREENYQI